MERPAWAGKADWVARTPGSSELCRTWPVPYALVPVTTGLLRERRCGCHSWAWTPDSRQRRSCTHQRNKHPARAGKTGDDASVTVSERKHPRACGEDHTRPGSTSTTSETPPRVRGRLQTSPRLDGIDGNTPARAGKTLTDLRFYSLSEMVLASTDVAIKWKPSTSTGRVLCAASPDDWTV